MRSLALVVLPFVACAVHASGFWKYHFQVKAGTSNPNFVSWAIWAFLATLNALSFMAITSLTVALQAFVGATGAIGTFAHALKTGRFDWPNKKEISVLVLGILAIVIWKLSSPLYANLILSGAIIISCWPSWVGVWKNPSKEKSLPWILWGSAYVLTALNTFLLSGATLKLTMPVVGIVIHWIIPAIRVYKKHQPR